MTSAFLIPTGFRNATSPVLNRKPVAAKPFTIGVIQNCQIPQRAGVSSASLGTSAVMPLALLLQ
jgi:hypothetical protein